MRRINPRHMERLLSPERRQWHEPEMILDALGAQAGMVVADIGSGPGFFTLPMATRVGPAGKVFAIDVEPQMLERLRERAAEAGVQNVEVLQSQEDSLPLPDGSIDAALMVNVLHESGKQATLLREVLRILRLGGSLVVVEWKKESSELGPPVEIRMGSSEVALLLQQAGYESIAPFPVGAHHHGSRARKPR